MVETALKVLLSIDPHLHEDTEEKLGDLLMTLFVLIRYLQDEYAVLMVSGTTNTETSRVFQAFRRNTSAFSQDVIDDLGNAAAVVAAGQVQAPTWQGYNNNNRGGYNNRGRSSWSGRGRGAYGRGGYQGGYRGRGNARGGQGGQWRSYDSYNQLSDSVPSARDGNDAY